MTALATDNFNRADAANLGTNWTQGKGLAGRISIVSNQGASGTSASRCGDFYNAVTWPADQYSQVKLVAVATTYDAGATVRMITTGSARNHYFGGLAANNFADKKPRMYKYVANAITSLGSGSVDLAAADTVKLQASGTGLTLFVNGASALTVTDASLSAGSAGLMLDNAAASTLLFEDWEGGNLSSGGGVLPWFRDMALCGGYNAIGL